jgi:hypothetical protein
MILFQLVCPENHPFESWFRDSVAFDDLKRKGQISCPHCGSHHVEKALMAPAVKSVRDDLPAEPAPHRPSARDIALIRKHIDANSEYVGMKFVTEARRMQAGEAPERMIHGEAKPAEALKLLEDGVPVIPLPFAPARKMN